MPEAAKASIHALGWLHSGDLCCMDECMGEIVSASIGATPGHYFDKEVLFTYLRERLSPQKHRNSGVRQVNFF